MVLSTTVTSSPHFQQMIGRIQSSSHASLPELQSGSGTGPLTIKNETSLTLTIYLSGTTDWKEIIPQHASTHVSLSPGLYKVAGELSDKSVAPFFGSGAILVARLSDFTYLRASRQIVCWF